MKSDDPNRPIPIISRRQFLLLTAGLGVIAGCQTGDDSGASAAAGVERIVNAGPVTRYAKDGVYSDYREAGFFVVRRGEQLVAVSAICTHKKCTLAAEPDRSFYCKCHGSTFDPNGKVTAGPAKRNLPMFPAVVDEQGQLQVKLTSGL
jgi:Rieske Fe-S protein